MNSDGESASHLMDCGPEQKKLVSHTILVLALMLTLLQVIGKVLVVVVVVVLVVVSINGANWA